jgi:hypothetical protein
MSAFNNRLVISLSVFTLKMLLIVRPWSEWLIVRSLL